MRARPVVSVVGGAAAIALASLLVASPAAAAPLPAGQRVDVIYSDQPEVGPGYSQMYQVSEFTFEEPEPFTHLAAAPAGPQAGAAIALGVDVLDDGLGFATVLDLLEDPDEAELWTADANTGALTDPHTIVGPDGFTFFECPGIDLQPSGQILVACNGTYEINQATFNVGVIGTLQLEPEGGDALLTPIIVEGDDDGEDSPDFTAIAVDPTDGSVWAFAWVAESFLWIPVDLANQSLGEGFDIGQSVDGADFDRDGQLWFTASGDGCDYMGTADPASETLLEYHGCFVIGEDDSIEGIQPITVWGAASALPATGPETAVPLGVGTALLFLVGAAFIAGSRLRSTTGVSAARS